MKSSDTISTEDIDSLQGKELSSEINATISTTTNNNESSIQSTSSLKNYSDVLLTDNNNSSSNLNLNTQLISQPQSSPSHPTSAGATTPFQQGYITSFTNVNPTRNIWIKRATDIDATKIPFSGEDIHDLKVSILQFFGPDFIGSSAELGFVTVWKDGKKLLPGQVIDADLLKGVTCENPLLLKNTHHLSNSNNNNNNNNNNNTNNTNTSPEILDFDTNKAINNINLEAGNNNQTQNKEVKPSQKSTADMNENDIASLKQRRQELSNAIQQDPNLLKSLQLSSNILPVNNLGLSNINNNNNLNIQGLSNLSNISNLNNLNILNQLNSQGAGGNSPGSLRQMTNLNSINNLTQLNPLNNINNNTTSSIKSINSLAPLSNTLVNLNSIQATLNNMNATTAASLNSNASINGVGMNNLINGLVSLQHLKGLTTSTFSDGDKLNPQSTVASIQDAAALALNTNQNAVSAGGIITTAAAAAANATTDSNILTVPDINSRGGSPAPDHHQGHPSDDEDALDPEEQLNAIYPPFEDIPKEIEDAVHRNTNRGWRLITIIDTNDIPKFFEDQPQDWRVQRSATDRYPGYLIINYIGGLEGERNNMPSKALNLTWSPETNDPSSKMYRKAKDLIDKQSMMYGSRFFCKGYPWCPSIVSSLTSIDAETTDISSKNGKKLAKRLKTSLNQSASVANSATSSPPPTGGNLDGSPSLYRNSNGSDLLLDGQSNSMKRNFDSMRHSHDSNGSPGKDDSKGNGSGSNQVHRSLKVSCNATLKIEIYASNLKKAVVYGKNLHGILGPISEYRPSDRIMSEACRAALSKDITYTRFLRQAEAMAIKYNIPKHRIPNRTQIRTFFERSRRGNRLASYTSNTDSPNPANAGINTNPSLLNGGLVSNMSNMQAIMSHQQPQETTTYSTITTASSTVSPNPHIQIPTQSPRLTLPSYHTTNLPNHSLIENVENVDMYSNNDLGIIKITPSFNSMNSLGFNSGLSAITSSIANDLTTGINTSIFTHTNSTNTTNTNGNNSNFHSNLFNS